MNGLKLTQDLKLLRHKAYKTHKTHRQEHKRTKHKQSCTRSEIVASFLAFTAFTGISNDMMTARTGNWCVHSVSSEQRKLTIFGPK